MCGKGQVQLDMSPRCAHAGPMGEGEYKILFVAAIAPVSNKWYGQYGGTFL